MASAMPGYLPSRRTSPPVDRWQIILFGDGDRRVWTTCLLRSRTSTGSRTRDLLMASLTPNQLQHHGTRWCINPCNWPL